MAVAHVQSNQGYFASGSVHGNVTSVSGSGSQIVTFTYTPSTTGNAVLIWVTQVVTSGSPTTFSLSASGWTITKTIAFINSGSSTYSALFTAYAPNTSTATFTSTISGGSVAGNSFFNDLIDEFSGIDATNFVDNSNSTFSSGTPTVTITPVNNNCMIWVPCNDSITAVGLIGGATATKGADDTQQDWTEYLLLSGGAGASQTCTFTGSSSYVIAAVSIKPAAASSTHQFTRDWTFFEVGDHRAEGTDLSTWNMQPWFFFNGQLPTRILPYFEPNGTSSVLSASTKNASTKATTASAPAWTGSDSEQINKSLAATGVANSGKTTRTASPSLKATLLACSAALSRGVSAAKSAASGWSAAISRSASKTLSASAVANSGALARTIGKALASVSAVAGGIVSRISGKALAAVSSPGSGSETRGIGKSLLGSSHWSGVTSKTTARLLSGVANAWAGLTGRVSGRPLSSVASAWSASTARNAGKSSMATSAAGSGSIARSTTKVEAGTFGPLSVALNRVFSKALSAQGAWNASLTRSIAKQIVASAVIWTATISRTLGRTLAATLGAFGVSATRTCSKLVSGSAAWQAAITKSTAKTISAIAPTLSGSLIRTINKAWSAASATFSGFLDSMKLVGTAFIEILAVFSAFSAAVTRSTGKDVEAVTHVPSASTSKSLARSIHGLAQSFGAAVSKRAGKALNASTAAFGGSLMRAASKALSATTATYSALVSLIRGKSFSAILATFSGSETKAISKTSTASMNPGSATTSKSIAKKIGSTAAPMLATVARSISGRITAVSATCSGAISILRGHLFSASMALFSGATSRSAGKEVRAASAQGHADTTRLIAKSLEAIQASWSGVLGAFNTSIETVRKFIVSVALHGWAVAQGFARHALAVVSPQALSWVVTTLGRSWNSSVSLRNWTITDESMIVTTKDPLATEDFQLNWAPEVGSDTIANSNWVVPSPLTLVQKTNTGTTATARIGGGLLNGTYIVSNVVTLVSGQVKSRSLTITIQVA